METTLALECYSAHGRQSPWEILSRKVIVAHVKCCDKWRQREWWERNWRYEWADVPKHKHAIGQCITAASSEKVQTSSFSRSHLSHIVTFQTDVTGLHWKWLLARLSAATCFLVDQRPTLSLKGLIMELVSSAENKPVSVQIKYLTCN